MNISTDLRIGANSKVSAPFGRPMVVNILICFFTGYFCSLELPFLYFIHFVNGDLDVFVYVIHGICHF